MTIKGLDKFQKKLPAFSGKKIAILPIFVACMVIIAFAIFFAFDSLPGRIEASGPFIILLSFSPLLGTIVVEVAGFSLVWQLWLWRDYLKDRYKTKSYQRIILFGLAGVSWILTITVHQFFPYHTFAPDFWASSPFQFLATPLQAYLGMAGLAFFFIKGAIALILLVIGLLMVIRAFQVFGFDYMVVLYLYFPEESQIQKNEIYSALRHPTYSGVLLICLGGAFFTFTILSFAAYLILLVGFYVHVRFFEEKELIERFGDSYLNYRRKVPAFFVNPKRFDNLFHFLLKKETDQ